MKKITKKLLSFVLAAAMIVPMFVFPSSAEGTAPELVNSPTGYSNIEVRVTTDKDPLSYRIGDKVTFTMKVYADNVHISVPIIKYWLEGDGSTELGVDKLYKSGELYPDENGVFTLTEDVISIPGYMRLEGEIRSSNGARWTETPDNDRAYALGAGILVNYEEINTVSPIPEDFDRVWDARLAELDAVAPKIVRIDKVTKWYSISTYRDLSADTTMDVYAIYIDCLGDSSDILKSDDLGNEAGATYAVAYLTVPRNKSDGSLPIYQGYQGYGINTATPAETTYYLAAIMSTHSVVLLNNENAATSAEFKEKYTSYIKDGVDYGRNTEANSKIETCYFANMLLRDVQVLRFMKQAFGSEGAASLVDENTIINGMTRDELNKQIEYWTGLANDDITTNGGSQGGFQAIGVAALEPGVVSVNANIPWMGDTHIGSDDQKVWGHPRPNYADGIRYCDTAFLVRRVTAPVTITAALVDRSCVPTGVIAIWNNLVQARADDEDYRASIVFTQTATHGYTPTYAENQKQTLRTYEIIEPSGIANNIGGFTKSGFTDIDGVAVDQDALPASTGYIQVGTSNQTTATVAEGYSPDLYYMYGANAYYNAEKKKLVFVSTGYTITASSGQHKSTATQNINDPGATWYLAYWASENAANIKEIEFRRGTEGTALGGIGYFTSLLTAAVSVKYDNALTSCTWGNSNTAALLVGMTSLTTAGHGSFAKDGTFTAKSYEDGVVNLTGFSGISDSNFSNVLYNCASVTEVVTHKLSGANMFEGCTKLKKVTVPDIAMVTSVGADCFKGCTRLENIDIQATISGITLGNNAFGGNAITINVNTSSDKEILSKALEDAGIANITIVTKNDVFDPIPKGYSNTDANFDISGFSDIDIGEGWRQIGGATEKAAVTQSGEMLIAPSLFEVYGGRAYFNEALGKLVIVATGGSLSANYGEQNPYTQATYDYNWANYAKLAIANHAAIMADPKAATYSAEGCTSMWISAANIGAYPTAYNAAIAEGKTDEEARAIAGEAVAEACLRWATIRNSADVGAVWKIAYWVNMNASKITELEVRTTTAVGLHSCAYWFGLLTSVESVKLCTNVRVAGFSQTNVGAFNTMSSLVSLGHGTFASDGTFTPTTYIPGRVDITGLSSSTAANLSYAFYKATSVSAVSTHAITTGMFSGASSLSKVIIPKGYTLSTISADAFLNCTSLEYIEIADTVDPAITIAANAFTGTSGVTVVVNTASEKGYVEAALTTSGITGVTVITTEDYVKVPTNAIKSEGFSVRMNGYTGLRALFSFNETISSANIYDGFTLVSYGVIASSYSRFVSEYGGDEDAFFAAARAVTNNEGSPIKYVPVYNADGTGANKYVDYDTRTFCVALTNIPYANSLSDIYMAGYAIWEDANGNESYTITTYNMADGQNAVNLYEITLGLTKNGIINSENTDDACFWQVLKNGALKTNSFNTENDSTAKGYTLPANGYFEYLDVDWHAYTGQTGTTGWNFNPTGVDSTASGVVWSVLKYTDNEYVMIYRNKDKKTYTNLKLPQYTENAAYLYYAPYDYRYGSTARIMSGATLTTYNPALTQADYEKIKTVVVDHGITSTAEGGFTGLAKVETIVYPNGLSGSGNYKFSYDSSLKNIIWCHTDDSGNSVEHMSEFEGLTSLADLRGFGNIALTSLFHNATALENVVFAEGISSYSVETMFNGTYGLKRVWTQAVPTPEEGIIDISQMSIQIIHKGVFNTGSNIKTIKLPATIADIVPATKNTDTDTRWWQILGQSKSFDFVCTDAVATQIAEYAAHIRANPKTDAGTGTVTTATAAYADKITVNGKSVLTLIQELGLE